MTTVERAWDDVTGTEADDGGARQVRYRIFGTSDFETAMAALIVQADATQGGLAAAEYGPPQRTSENTWDAIVSYGMLDTTTGKREPPQKTGEDEFSLDTTGGTKKISHYRSAPTQATTGGTIPDFKWGIAVTKDGPEGADIGQASCKFTITRVLEDASVPSSYLNMLFQYTYCVNSATTTLNASGKTLTFEPGELLFLGASVTFSRASEKWRIVFHFAGQPNESRTLNGMTIVVRGWDHVWVYTEPDTQNDSGKSWLVQVPKAIFSGKVYREADLNDLGV